MTTVAWVTLGLTALIIAAAALGLFRIILHLTAITRTLANVVGGVGVIADQTSTVPTVVPSVNESLRPVREFCDSIELKG